MNHQYTLEYAQYTNSPKTAECFTSKQACAKRLNELCRQGYEVQVTGMRTNDFIDYCPTIGNVFPISTPSITLYDDLWATPAA